MPLQYIHTYILIYTNTQTAAWLQTSTRNTYVHTRMHNCLHMIWPTETRAKMSVCSYAYGQYPSTSIPVSTCMYTQNNIYIYICIHIYICIPFYIHINLYKHVHMHISICHRQHIRLYPHNMWTWSTRHIHSHTSIPVFTCIHVHI